MAFPSLIWRFLMQLAAQKTLNCTDCALRPRLVGARPFHNGNIVANCPVLPSVLRRSRNRPNSQATEPTGVKNVEQVYAIYSDRDGAWHRDGNAGLQLSARYKGGYRSGRKPDRDAVPAPDQDDHRAAGVRDPGRRHRPYGKRLQTGADFRKDHGLVCQRVLRLAAAWACDGQPVAAGLELSRHPAGQGAV